MRDAIGVALFAIVAALALFEIGAVVTHQWEATFSEWVKRDWRVYVGLSALLLAIWLHLTVMRYSPPR